MSRSAPFYPSANPNRDRQPLLGRRRPWRRLLWVLCVATAAAAPANAQQSVDFDSIAPLLNQRCVICHVGEAAPNGLRLDSYDGLMTGSTRGPVVRPRSPRGSELLRRVRGESQPRMPLVGDPRATADIERIERWIAAGAKVGTGQTSMPVTPPVSRRPHEPPTYADVAPILTGRCAKCHSDNGIMGRPPEGYRLDSWAGATAAAERARIVPGNPLASELIRKVKGTSRPRMPFDGPPWLSDEQIALLEAWVAAGAQDATGRRMPIPVGAEVRLRGILTDPDAVDGARFVPGGRSRGARVGGEVEVRVRIEPDGRLQATRLRGRE